MLLSEFVTILRSNPVIPCTNNLNDYSDKRFSLSKIILLYDFSIFDIRKFETIKNNTDKFTIFSIETMSGIANDAEGVKFLKNTLNIQAIESSSPRALSYAKKNKMLTIQTIFSFDSKSISKAAKLMEEIKPDFIDIRPGISLMKFKNIFTQVTNQKIICSGLITDKSEIDLLLKNGAVAVTTSKKDLWSLYY